MTIRWSSGAGAAVCSLLLAACSGMAANPPRPAGLDGTSWVLLELPGHALVSAGNVTLQFVDGRAGGSDGCNRFSGGFTADARSLQFQQQAATQMACAPDITAQASAVTGALGATRSYRVDGQKLELLDDAGRTVAIYTAQSTRIEGTAWEVTAINNGKGGVASLAGGTQVTLQFGAEARASGSAGCNRFTAGYARDMDALTFTPAAATKMMCATPGVMEQEQAFLHALQRVATMRFDGDRLELRAADGALQVAARRAAPTP